MLRYLALFLLYCTCLFGLTSEWSGQISEQLLAHGGDGFQSVWNIWWVHEALFSLRVHPWFTPYLYFPGGASLVAHTLNLSTNVPAALVAPWFDLRVLYNVCMLLTFPLSGVAAAILFRRLEPSWIGATVAGLCYAFTSYRFAHAHGHINLLTMQWIPIFLLVWWSFLEVPSARRAGGAALTLLLVLFSDYYYFLYSVLCGAILFFALVRERQLRDRQFWIGLILFVALVSAVTVPLISEFSRLARAGFVNKHDPLALSADLSALIAPGGYSQFSMMAAPWWGRIRAGAIEGSVYLGLATVLLALIGACFSSTASIARRRALTATGIGFLLLALGPRLQFLGEELLEVPMPYSLLLSVFPLLEFAAVPVRFVVAASIPIALLAGLGAAQLMRVRLGTVLLLILVALHLIEVRPVGLSITEEDLPLVIAETKFDRRYALLDRGVATHASRSMWYQTVHGLPVIDGYISRVPVPGERRRLKFLRMAERGQWRVLCERYGIRYVIAPVTLTPHAPPEGSAIQTLGDNWWFDIGESYQCAEWRSRFPKVNYR
jgi:hypothetical protein